MDIHAIAQEIAASIMAGCAPGGQIKLCFRPFGACRRSARRR
jgi:hypothetical protein